MKDIKLRPGDTQDKQLPDIPEEIVFCTKCVVSNQRPRITFDEEGVCSACRYAEQKQSTIDWEAREKMLWELCEEHRSKDGQYDCIVPSSGGKDSAMVAHKLKHKYGMHPLTITWAPFMYTEIGYKNFWSFSDHGFDNLLATPNGYLRRLLSKRGFELVGDPWAPFTYGQYFLAPHMACRFNIPLVFFGENGEAEYGGSMEDIEKPGVPLWTLDSFPILKGNKARDLLTPEDWESNEFTEADFCFYEPPSAEDLQRVKPYVHYFGFYEQWTPQHNYYYAVENTGFEANPERSEGTYSKYASLDDRLDGFHYYMAFIKFGIGRATSDAAHEVRDGHLTREEAVALVQRYDGEFPKKYFGEFLDYLQITEERFWEVVDHYRRPNVWSKDNHGDWSLRKQVS